MAEAANDTLEAVALAYERIIPDLERAIAHLRVSAAHFRDREVPRGCAHALATQGHLVTAQRLLNDLAVLHASKSNA